MILLAAALLAGDAWTWNASLRYDDARGPLLEDRERWTVRIGPDRALTAERRFVGTVDDDGTIVPPSAVEPEVLKGRVERDGTLTVEGNWSRPEATRALRRLLRPDPKRDLLLPGEGLVRKALLRDPDARLPGSDLRATLRIEATLASARLGGRDVDLAPGR